ncbi:MAG: DEAD/DEAH box helicase [Lachnospiraceae bacterium]
MDLIKYTESGLDKRIIKAVTEMGFSQMTPIQSQAIPVLLEGHDIIGQAQTGTGKTAAFGIPVIQSVDPKERSVQAIILCPTRELAIQAANEIRRFSKYIGSIKVVPVYGGQDISGQIKLLKSGAQIVVGTPGRVMDHMKRKTLKFDSIKTVVLDEADEMLNMGFREDMETILKEMPKTRQTALFSATMPKAILDITKSYQKADAVHIKVAAKELTVPLIKQYYYTVKSKYKAEAVKRLIQVNNISRSIIFCNTKKMVDELVGALKSYGYMAEGLHGDLSQKQRDMVMKHFRSGTTEILIATDVAARGIDVDDLEAVINYDIPQDIEYYVHRIGRTGRAGKEGKAFTLISGREIYKIRDIEKICRTKMTKGQLPTGTEITSIQAEKYIGEAKKYIGGQKISLMKNLVEYELSKGEFTAEELAAALLKIHIGDEAAEYNIEEKYYEFKSSNERKYEDKYGRDKKAGTRKNMFNRQLKSVGDYRGKKKNDGNAAVKNAKSYKSTRKFGKK